MKNTMSVCETGRPPPHIAEGHFGLDFQPINIKINIDYGYLHSMVNVCTKFERCVMYLSRQGVCRRDPLL